MSAIIGVALICASLIVIRMTAAAVRLRPVPWWASDGMTSYVSVPFCVAALAGGAAALIAWSVTGAWRATTLADVAILAAILVAYVFASRALKGWAERASPALVAVAASNDPDVPPRVPPLKKAA